MKLSIIWRLSDREEKNLITGNSLQKQLEGYTGDIQLLIYKGNGQTFEETLTGKNLDISIYDINNICFKNPNVLEFTYKNDGDIYGDSISSSPIWIRPNSLLKDKVSDWFQVVGHTEYITKNNNYYLKGNCYFIDNSQNAYMVQDLDNNILNNISIKTIR